MQTKHLDSNDWCIVRDGELYTSVETDPRNATMNRRIKFLVVTVHGKIVGWFTNEKKLRRFIKHNDPSLVVKYVWRSNFMATDVAKFLRAGSQLHVKQ